MRSGPWRLAAIFRGDGFIWAFSPAVSAPFFCSGFPRWGGASITMGTVLCIVFWAARKQHLKGGGREPLLPLPSPKRCLPIARQSPYGFVPKPREQGVLPGCRRNPAPGSGNPAEIAAFPRRKGRRTRRARIQRTSATWVLREPGGRRRGREAFPRPGAAALFFSFSLFSLGDLWYTRLRISKRGTKACNIPVKWKK